MNTANVSTGKPNTAGALARAPLGSTLPIDAKTALDAAFKQVGYVSDDGVENDNAPDSDNIKAWGGMVVCVVNKGKEDKFKFTMIEPKNLEVIKSIYGDDNVTGTLDTGIVVKANNNDQDAAIWVIDMIMKGNVLKRIVIPNAVLSDLGTITYKDDEAIGYECTLSAMPDASGNTHYEYITSQEVA